MPLYQYECPSNGRILEATHPMDVSVTTWGELCRWAGVFPGATPDDTPVQRIFGSAPNISKPAGNSRLRDAGFTKFVKRDDGVYENVTADKDASRVLRVDHPDAPDRD